MHLVLCRNDNYSTNINTFKNGPMKAFGIEVETQALKVSMGLTVSCPGCLEANAFKPWHVSMSLLFLFSIWNVSNIFV